MGFGSKGPIFYFVLTYCYTQKAVEWELNEENGASGFKDFGWIQLPKVNYEHEAAAASCCLTEQFIFSLLLHSFVVLQFHMMNEVQMFKQPLQINHLCLVFQRNSINVHCGRKSNNVKNGWWDKNEIVVGSNPTKIQKSNLCTNY